MSTAHEQFVGMIPHLPEGVNIVQVRLGRPGEFEFYGKQIVRAIRGSGTMVIVAPAKGWEFVPDLEHVGVFKAQQIVTPAA